MHIDTSRPEQLKIRFSWPLDQPDGVMSVLGSFNAWTAGLDELIADCHGQRSVTLGLPYSQRFVFRYLGSDGQWFDDPVADDITTAGSIINPIPSPRQ